jgi:hypothetical protein
MDFENHISRTWSDKSDSVWILVNLVMNHRVSQLPENIITHVSFISLKRSVFHVVC